MASRVTDVAARGMDRKIQSAGETQMLAKYSLVSLCWPPASLVW